MKQLRNMKKFSLMVSVLMSCGIVFSQEGEKKGTVDITSA